jgi:hypothetical protein
MNPLTLVRISHFPRHEEIMAVSHMAAVRFARLSTELEKTSFLVPFLRRN